MTIMPTHAASGISVADELSGAEADAGFQFWATPHRSMSDAGFAAFILAILSVAVLAQLYCLVIGIWVAGVAAIFDGLFLAAAFLACRSDRKRLEIVSFSNGMVHVERRRGNGEVIFEKDIPAAGLELLTTIDPEFGVQRIELLHRDKAVEIAGELSPVERACFAEALAQALTARGFPPRHVARRLANNNQSQTQT